MKNVIKIGIIATSCLFALPALAEFKVTKSDTLRTECVNSIDHEFTTSNGKITKTLYDQFSTNSGDKYISNSRTRISIWSSEPNLISGCLNSDEWIKKSDVAPAGISVVYVAASCLFHKPKQKNSIDVQIVYETGFSRITAEGNKKVTKEFITPEAFLEDSNAFQSITYPNYKSIPEGVAAPDCFNIDLM